MIFCRSSKYLEPGIQTAVLQPLARAPSRYSAEDMVEPSPEALLPALLLLDVKHASGLHAFEECFRSAFAGKVNRPRLSAGRIHFQDFFPATWTF